MITLCMTRAISIALDSPDSATLEGKAMHNVQNAMAAAVVAYAQGIKLENIRQGLRTFDTSYFQVRVDSMSSMSCPLR